MMASYNIWYIFPHRAEHVLCAGYFWQRPLFSSYFCRLFFKMKCDRIDANYANQCRNGVRNVGSFRKWMAAFLAVCVTVTSVGMDVRAQYITEEKPVMEQEDSAAGEEQPEARDSQEAKIKDSGEKQARDSQEAKIKDSGEEQARDSQEADNKQAAGLLNFAMVESAEIQTPGVQNIAVSLGRDGEKVERAELTYQKAAGEVFTAEAAEIADNMVKFTIEYTDKAQSGIYELVSVRYQAEGKEYEVKFVELGMEVSFGVNQESENEPDDMLIDGETLEDLEANVVTVDENGNTVSEQSITDVLQEAQTTDVLVHFGRAAASADKKMVIVLDPGHDNVHAGARGNGCKEEELTLKIAQYCKAELQKYSGVTIYMTRTTNDCANGGYAVSSSECNARRVAYGVSKKADVYVSFHLNSSTSSAPRGVGVYYPNNSYRPKLGEEGKGLATDIYKQLSALGLQTWAGGILIHNSEDNTLYPDGSLADYLAIIRRNKEAGIPAVLIEHAFLSNAADVSEFLNSNEKLKKLGIADAQGIAGYYGLSLKGDDPQIEWTKSIKSQKLRISWGEVQGAVSYQVYRSDSEDGKYESIAEVSKCQYDDKKVQAGVTYFYKICAVFEDGKKSSLSEAHSGATLQMPQITSVVSKSGGKLKVSWKGVNGATEYEVLRSEALDGKYVKIATTAKKAYTDSKRETQKEYFYKVRARGGEQNGSSTDSAAASGWAVKQTVIRSVSSADSNSLRIRWKKVENASAYRIQRSTSQKGKYKTVAEVKGNKTSYVNKGLKAKKTYYYKIQALNLVGNKTGCGSYSSPVSGQTITGTSVSYVKSVNSSIMELKWKKNTSAYAYSIKRSRTKNGAYEKIAEIRDKNITQYQDKHVVSGNRYYYVVEVVSNKKGVKGYSGNSKPVSAVSLKKVNIVSIEDTEEGFLLNWEKAPGANCYEILRSTKKKSGFTQIAKVKGADALSYTDGNVTEGMKYYYRIRAVREGKRMGYGSYGKVAESANYMEQ